MFGEKFPRFAGNRAMRSGIGKNNNACALSNLCRNFCNFNRIVNANFSIFFDGDSEKVINQLDRCRAGVECSFQNGN